MLMESFLSPMTAISKTLRPVIVLGSWSSGTTAVAGYLAKNGLHSCPPHALTKDPRTPDCYESLAFRKLCQSVCSEHDLRVHKDFMRAAPAFQQWIQRSEKEALDIGKKGLVLKYPLCGLIIPLLASICTPRWIVVTRPFQDIENTRLRRGWPELFGKKGAGIIYSRIFSSLNEQQQPFLAVPFPQFRASEQSRHQLLRYLDMPFTPASDEWVVEPPDAKNGEITR